MIRPNDVYIDAESIAQAFHEARAQFAIINTQIASPKIWNGAAKSERQILIETFQYLITHGVIKRGGGDQ